MTRDHSFKVGYRTLFIGCRKKRSIVTYLHACFFSNITPIDHDDSDRFFDDLKEILTKFALAANAMPLRTPNMLMATVKVIGNNPRDFLQDSEKFDPEAAALVIGACGGRSSINKRLLLEYESGIGSGPPPEEIANAAEQVLVELSQKSTLQPERGRPIQVAQGELANSLAKVYLTRGGIITRNVGRDGDQETGPFHKFLELLLPAVHEIARRAGITLTVATMVAKAQKGLKSRI